jgi:hypothetical protein
MRGNQNELGTTSGRLPTDHARYAFMKTNKDACNKFQAGVFSKVFTRLIYIPIYVQTWEDFLTMS